MLSGLVKNSLIALGLLLLRSLSAAIFKFIYLIEFCIYSFYLIIFLVIFFVYLIKSLNFLLLFFHMSIQLFYVIELFLSLHLLPFVYPICLLLIFLHPRLGLAYFSLNILTALLYSFFS
jgi:hypothetical protein